MANSVVARGWPVANRSRNRYQDLDSDLYNDLRKYGVKGDGSTDDTTSLQAWITACEAASLTTSPPSPDASSYPMFPTALFLPKPLNGKFYLTSAPLTFGTKHLTRLMGAGPGVCIYNATPNSDVLRINYGGTALMQGHSVENLTLRGTGSGSCAIRANLCDGLLINRVWALKHPGAGIILQSITQKTLLDASNTPSLRLSAISSVSASVQVSAGTGSTFTITVTSSSPTETYSNIATPNAAVTAMASSAVITLVEVLAVDGNDPTYNPKVLVASAFKSASFSGCGWTHILDCEFSAEAAVWGIADYGGLNTVIENCQLTRYDVGIYAENTRGTRILNCRFEDGTYQSTTALNGGINDSVASLTVTSTSMYVPGDILRIGTEQMYVTDVTSATVLAVSRAYANTTAASHSDVATVYRARASIRVRSTVLGQEKRFVYISGGYFENNGEYSVDADKGVHVDIEDAVMRGKVDTANVLPVNAIRMDGGGEVRRLRGGAGGGVGAGVNIQSPYGRTRVYQSTGFWGRLALASSAAGLEVEGINTGWNDRQVNQAGKSWFRTAPNAWNVSGVYSPTAAHDVGTNGLYGGLNSYKLTFASNAPYLTLTDQSASGLATLRITQLVGVGVGPALLRASVELSGTDFRIRIWGLGTTTLTADVTAGATSWPVASSSGFSNGDLVNCGSEIVTVNGTPPDSTHLTVTRASGGTTAASHSSASSVNRNVESWGTYSSPAAAVTAISGTSTRIDIANLASGSTPATNNPNTRAVSTLLDSGSGMGTVNMGPNPSNATYDSTKLASTLDGDLYSSAVVFKCDTANQVIAIRQTAGSDGANTPIITDTNWNVCVMESLCNTNGGTTLKNYTLLHLGKAITSSLVVYIAGIAAAINGSALGLFDTEGAAFGNHEINAHTFRMGGTGTPIKAYFSGAASLDFGSISANTSAELTIAVAGAAVGDTAIATPSTSLESGLVSQAYVSAANTVTVRLGNVTTGAIDPAAKSWRATVIQH